MIKEILTIKSDREFLKQACTPIVVPEEDELKRIYSALVDTFNDINSFKPRAAGLAANQIGISKRAFIMKWGDSNMVLFNPEIIAYKGKRRLSSEGCLSRPGMQNAKVMRHQMVKVKFWVVADYINLSIREKTMTFKGFDAIVVQHEIDHLNGKII